MLDESFHKEASPVFFLRRAETMSTGTDETTDRLFPMPQINEILRSTYVMFDAEDFSIENPLLFKKNIVTAIKNDGYRGRIDINAFFGVKEIITRELLDLYVKAGIYSELFEGDRVTRMNMMFVRLLFWARTQYPNGSNVLIITKNENLLDQHKVWNIIDGLEQRDFYFAIEHPDTFNPGINGRGDSLPEGVALKN